MDILQSPSVAATDTQGIRRLLCSSATAIRNYPEFEFLNGKHALPASFISLRRPLTAMSSLVIEDEERGNGGAPRWTQTSEMMRPNVSYTSSLYPDQGTLRSRASSFFSARASKPQVGSEDVCERVGRSLGLGSRARSMKEKRSRENLLSDRSVVRHWGPLR